MTISATEGYEYAEEARGKGNRLLIPKDALIHHALASEFCQVCRTPIDGVFVSPSAQNQFLWFGLAFIRKGIFGGGIFRFKIHIPSDFPDTTTLPEVVFQNAIFHPLVELKTNKLELSRSFPDGWKKEKHNLIRVLIVIQRIFFSYEFDCDKCINPEAAILYKEDKDKFRLIAKDVVETSRAQVYDEPKNSDDPNSIRLTPWDASIHESVREQMIAIGNGQQRSVGTSSPSTATATTTPTTTSSSKAAPKPRISTAAEFRKDRKIRENGIVMSEVVGKHFPASYSWFDPDEMTVLTQKTVDDASSELSSARIDREKHGIEPLDLSTISSDAASENNSPVMKIEKDGINGSRKLQKTTLSKEAEIEIDQQEGESVI